MSVDYTSFNSNGQLNSQASPTYDAKWYEIPDDQDEQLASATFGVVKYLQSNQSLRMTNLLTSTRLYGNMSLMGMNGLTYSKLASVTSSNSSRLTYNVVQSSIDTVTAKIAKNKPRPLFLTDGGDYKLQRRAQKLSKFVEGVFYENHAHDLGVEVFRDSAIWGTGAFFVYDHYGRIKYERCIITELLVDEVEAFYGKPRSMYRLKSMDRSVAKQLAISIAGGDKSKEKRLLDLVEGANKAQPDDLGGYRTISDLIQVVEAWHLPSGPDADDGKHVISLAKGTLLTEEYDKCFFPFVFLHWSKKLFGFWGQGLSEQIQNIQLEINKLLWVMQRSYHLAGSFKILLENGSKIVKEHLNNDIGSVVTYTGTPPQYVVPPIVQPEAYQHLERLKEDAFAQAGISQMSAASQKPAGLNSGKALREFNDIESDRFMTVGQSWERFFVDLAQITVSLAKSMYWGSAPYKVKVPGKKFIETIDWKDVHMHEDAFLLKCYPVSALPNEPAGRLQTIQELMQAGLIDPESGRRLLDYPDLDAEEDLNNAPQDYLHEILDKMVDDGEYTAPEPYDNLDLAHKLALEYYAKYKTSGLEEERLELFRQFIEQIQMLKTAAQQQQAQAAQQAQQQMQPQAAPQPQPQSDLVPNQPGLQLVGGQ